MAFLKFRGDRDICSSYAILVHTVCSSSSISEKPVNTAAKGFGEICENYNLLVGSNVNVTFTKTKMT